MGKDRNKIMLWENIITRSLNRNNAKYICIAKKAMVGCFILLYIKDENKYRVSLMRSSKVKTGFGGQSGNKGAVSVRFNFDDTSFSFMNCHLTSGHKQVAERLDDLRDIYKKSFD